MRGGCVFLNKNRKLNSIQVSVIAVTFRSGCYLSPTAQTPHLWRLREPTFLIPCTGDAGKSREMSLPSSLSPDISLRCSQ